MTLYDDKMKSTCKEQGQNKSSLINVLTIINYNQLLIIICYVKMNVLQCKNVIFYKLQSVSIITIVITIIKQ